MTKPTIFGMNGSSLMAGGEAGREAVLPLKGFYQQLDQMISRLSEYQCFGEISGDHCGRTAARGCIWMTGRW